jgi:hypothetical protein
MVALYAMTKQHLDSDVVKADRYSFVGASITFYVSRFTHHTSLVCTQTVLVIYSLKCNYNPGQPELL